MLADMEIDFKVCEGPYRSIQLSFYVLAFIKVLNSYLNIGRKGKLIQYLLHSHNQTCQALQL